MFKSSFDVQGVGLNPNTHIHLTDHLAPLCVIMDIPLLVTDFKYAEEAEQLYPELKTLCIDWIDFTPEFLIDNFTLFFQSELWARQKFYQTFHVLEKERGKIVRNVHCPHGFSDKIFWLEQGAYEDILLYYGKNMEDMFEAQGLASHISVKIRTGNYRYQYYIKHQLFYEQLIRKKLETHLDLNRFTLLYAPTCSDVEQSTSLFHTETLFKNLPDHYNLIIKIHPALGDTEKLFLDLLIEKYKKKNNIFFLTDFSLVLPLLAHVDAYIGDMSSIGYDFLAFNKPMFFLNQLKRNPITDKRLFLYQCGIEIKPEQYANFYSILDQHLLEDTSIYKKKREEVYQYTFGSFIPFVELKQTIKQAYFSPKKYD